MFFKLSLVQQRLTSAELDFVEALQLVRVPFSPVLRQGNRRGRLCICTFGVRGTDAPYKHVAVGSLHDLVVPTRMGEPHRRVPGG